MATARIGFFADPHWPVRETNTATDTDYLYNTLGSDIVIWGGDQMGGKGQDPPHNSEQDIRDFWDMVDSNGDLDTTYAVPGNHDIPIPFYEEVSRDYIGERAATPQKIQPIDGVTCLLFNSVGPGDVDGGYYGVGMTDRYVPLTELDWLVSEIQEAHSRGDIVLLFTHASLWFSQNSNPPEYHPEAPFGDRSVAAMRAKQTTDYRHKYFIVSNYRTVMEQLTANSPVCVFHGDSYYTGWEGYHNIGGMYHTWQEHWAQGPNTTPTTFSYIDVDTSTGQVLFKTVAHSDKTENTVMDVTASW